MNQVRSVLLIEKVDGLNLKCTYLNLQDMTFFTELFKILSLEGILVKFGI